MVLSVMAVVSLSLSPQPNSNCVCNEQKSGVRV